MVVVDEPLALAVLWLVAPLSAAVSALRIPPPPPLPPSPPPIW